jgi:ferric iron reductase protein FhuF
LVLYDAEGGFDRNFDWWKGFGKHRLVEPQLPFKNGRSDLLTGSGSRLDIENINLLATLLVHAQHQGYWNQLGMQFQEEMEALLERHLLNGLVDAPWVRTDDPESDDDDRFFAALQELVAYAFEESTRIKKEGWHEKSIMSSGGILQEVQSLLQKYRNELVRQAQLLDQGGRA